MTKTDQMSLAEVLVDLCGQAEALREEILAAAARCEAEADREEPVAEFGTERFTVAGRRAVMLRRIAEEDMGSVVQLLRFVAGPDVRERVLRTALVRCNQLADEASFLRSVRAILCDLDARKEPEEADREDLYRLACGIGDRLAANNGGAARPWAEIRRAAAELAGVTVGDLERALGTTFVKRLAERYPQPRPAPDVPARV